MLYPQLAPFIKSLDISLSSAQQHDSLLDLFHLLFCEAAYGEFQLFTDLFKSSEEMWEMISGFIPWKRILSC